MKDNVYIERIIKYAQKISSYLVKVKLFDEFEANYEKIDAVILNLEKLVRLQENYHQKQKTVITTLIGQVL